MLLAVLRNYKDDGTFYQARSIKMILTYSAASLRTKPQSTSFRSLHSVATGSHNKKIEIPAKAGMACSVTA